MEKKMIISFGWTKDRCIICGKPRNEKFTRTVEHGELKRSFQINVPDYGYCSKGCLDNWNQLDKVEEITGWKRNLL
jgi:hypothetical protein